MRHVIFYDGSLPPTQDEAAIEAAIEAAMKVVCHRLIDEMPGPELPPTVSSLATRLGLYVSGWERYEIDDEEGEAIAAPATAEGRVFGPVLAEND